MLISIVVILVVVIAGVLAFAATKPPRFRVERSARIAAPADRLHNLTSDFHNWPQWSPWEKLDPAMKRTHSGAAKGTGAVYEWWGNKKAGEGRMEIIDAPVPSRVVIKLDFLKPFEAHNTIDFAFIPNGAATDVTWSMFGPSPFVSKVMGLFVNMDRMIGRDFEEGLANLKTVAER